MVLLVDADNRTANRPLVTDMHRDRKRIFIDRLGWDVPVHGDEERDEFDDADATYLIVEDDWRGHLGSVRLLSTERPHLLDTIFPSLCEDVPTGPDIREVSRLCFAPKCRGGEYRHVRDQLTTALVEYALLTGIRAYTLVAGMSVYSGVLSQGWRCTPLGLPRPMRGEELAAMLIRIEPETIERLRQAGTYVPQALKPVSRILVAA
jgi:N-acyl-L-homoserine lactone synthetase